MTDNYYRALDFIEKHPSDANIDTEELNQLMLEMTRSNKKEMVIHCQMKLKKIKRKLFFMNFKYGMLGALLAILFSLVFYYLFAEDFFYLLILPCVYLVFLLKPKNHPLAKKLSKYTTLKLLFSNY